MQKWIDCDYVTTGTVGFLIESANAVAGFRNYDLSDRPARTNLSNEPRLHGWCGSYNGITTYARGLVRVTKVLRNGRAQVTSVPDDELEDALDKLGYPELFDEEGEE